MERLFLALCLLSFSGIVRARLSGEGIIGGDFATQVKFPYQISLQRDGTHQCGGGIIGERFILTAAHCVADRQARILNDPIKIIAGEADWKDPVRGVTVDVETVYIPKSYNPSYSFANDIAVLKIKRDLGINNNGLRKLQLPRNDESYVGQMATVSGYGYNWVEIYYEEGKKKEGDFKIDSQLRYLNTRILSNEECNRTTKHTSIFDTKICAQGVQRYIAGKIEGICSGDSGGALVVGKTVVGVASTSPRGCEENVEAAAYTRVSKFIDFIDKVVNGIQSDDIKFLNLDRPTYEQYPQEIDEPYDGYVLIEDN